MVDENRAIFFTKHIHYDPQTGRGSLCPELKEQVEHMFEKGFRRAEGFLKLNADGSLDFTEAMYLVWREGNHGHKIL